MKSSALSSVATPYVGTLNCCFCVTVCGPSFGFNYVFSDTNIFEVGTSEIAYKNLNIVRWHFFTSHHKPSTQRALEWKFYEDFNNANINIVRRLRKLNFQTERHAKANRFNCTSRWIINNFFFSITIAADPTIESRNFRVVIWKLNLHESPPVVVGGWGGSGRKRGGRTVVGRTGIEPSAADRGTSGGGSGGSTRTRTAGSDAEPAETQSRRRCPRDPRK